MTKNHFKSDLKSKNYELFLNIKTEKNILNLFIISKKFLKNYFFSANTLNSNSKLFKKRSKQTAERFSLQKKKLVETIFDCFVFQKITFFYHYYMEIFVRKSLFSTKSFFFVSLFTNWPKKRPTYFSGNLNKGRKIIDKYFTLFSSFQYGIFENECFILNESLSRNFKIKCIEEIKNKICGRRLKHIFISKINHKRANKIEVLEIIYNQIGLIASNYRRSNIFLKKRVKEFLKIKSPSKNFYSRGKPISPSILRLSLKLFHQMFYFSRISMELQKINSIIYLLFSLKKKI